MHVNKIDGTTETTHGELFDLLQQAGERLAEPDVESVEIVKNTTKNPAIDPAFNRHERRKWAAQFKQKPQPKKRKKGKR